MRTGEATITYSLLPKDAVLPVYCEELENQIQMSLAKLDRRLQLRGSSPRSRLSKQEEQTAEYSCEPNSVTRIFQADSPGAITRIEFDFGNAAQEDLAALLPELDLRIYWDDEEQTSVRCSVANFFASTAEGEDFRTLVVSRQRNAVSCDWYMPYQKARMQLENHADHAVMLKTRIACVPLEDARSLMRFHAKQHGNDYAYLDESRFEKGGDRWPDWPVLLCKGRGRFCGIHLVVDNRWPMPEAKPSEWWYGIGKDKTIHWWWDEGDEKFFVDSEKFPSSFGTGSEDYVGYAWAAEPPHVFFDSAYACQNAVPLDGNGVTSLARFHICDNIPFTTGFEGFLEKYSAEQNGSDRTCTYVATAFWYLLHDGKQVDYYED